MTLDLLVNIDVDDLARATAFYTAAFPLRIGRRFGDGGVELLGASSPIYLLVKPAGSEGAPGARRGYARHWTPVHLDLAVPDLDAAVARATAAGAVLESPATVRSLGHDRHARRPVRPRLLPDRVQRAGLRRDRGLMRNHRRRPQALVVVVSGRADVRARQRYQRLVRPHDDVALSAFMRWLTMALSRRWQALHQRPGLGTLYQGRYRSCPVEPGRPPAHGAALHRAQPGPRRAGGECRGLALVERARAPGRPRRPAGAPAH